MFLLLLLSPISLRSCLRDLFQHSSVSIIAFSRELCTPPLPQVKPRIPPAVEWQHKRWVRGCRQQRQRAPRHLCDLRNTASPKSGPRQRLPAELTTHSKVQRSLETCREPWLVALLFLRHKQCRPRTHPGLEALGSLPCASANRAERGERTDAVTQAVTTDRARKKLAGVSPSNIQRLVSCRVAR